MSNDKEEITRWYNDSRLWAIASVTTFPLFPPLAGMAIFTISGCKSVIEGMEFSNKDKRKRNRAKLSLALGIMASLPLARYVAKDTFLSDPIPHAEIVYEGERATIEKNYHRDYTLDDFLYNPLIVSDNGVGSYYTVNINSSKGDCSIKLIDDQNTHKFPDQLIALENQHIKSNPSHIRYNGVEELEKYRRNKFLCKELAYPLTEVWGIHQPTLMMITL